MTTTNAPKKRTATMWRVAWAMEPGPLNPFGCSKTTLNSFTSDPHSALAEFVLAHNLFDGVERHAWLLRHGAPDGDARPYRYLATPDGCVVQAVTQ